MGPLILWLLTTASGQNLDKKTTTPSLIHAHFSDMTKNHTKINKGFIRHDFPSFSSLALAFGQFGSSAVWLRTSVMKNMVPWK